MTQRERTLESEGYFYASGFATNEAAKGYAKKIRGFGHRATVLTESRNGICFYSVWIKHKEV